MGSTTLFHPVFNNPEQLIIFGRVQENILKTVSIANYTVQKSINQKSHIFGERFIIPQVRLA